MLYRRPPLWVFALALLLNPCLAYAGTDAAQVSGGVFSGEAWASVFTVTGLVALFTLAGLEIVLGIDNIVFLTVLTSRLPESQRDRARRIGLLAAMLSRIGLLMVVGWLMRLTEDLFQLPWINGDSGVSGKDLILLVGGAFLLAKATKEIHEKVEHTDAEGPMAPGAEVKAASFASVILQVMLIDMVFSLDSVVTAVGMTQNIPVMILAVVASVGVMMVAAGPIGDFVERHPAVKILALAFLVLIGALLIAEGFGRHVEKGYIYFAMAFSLVVELLQLRAERRKQPPEA